MPKTNTPKSTKAIQPSLIPSTAKFSPAHMLAIQPIITQIVLARLEADKSFDWYDLSLRLNQGKPATMDAKKKGGKKKKDEGDDEKILSGNELLDVYYDVSATHWSRPRAEQAMGVG